MKIKIKQLVILLCSELRYPLESDKFEILVLNFVALFEEFNIS